MEWIKEHFKIANTSREKCTFYFDNLHSGNGMMFCLLVNAMFSIIVTVVDMDAAVVETT